MEKINYCCEFCNYQCLHDSHWQQHIKTKKHINNGVIKRNKSKIDMKCAKCTFSTNEHTNFKLHCLTKHSTPEEKKKNFRFYCDKCNFGTFGKINFERHCESQKHINNTKLY